MQKPSFTLGIEEEYFLVDAGTRDLIRELPAGLLETCKDALGEQVTTEFLQCQLEVGTRVCESVAEARADLARLRATLVEVARGYGLALLAASTHPFANWAEQRTNPVERYQMLARDLQEVVRRLLIGGMHVHVGVDDPELRIDLMSQATYVLPHLLALSTSSPFWTGHDTGMMSYRVSIWDELPRTGIPEAFESTGEYERHVAMLVGAGLLQDATLIWWDVRPSARFPTLEMRLTDVCTRLDDAICIAALYRCWLHMLYRLRRNNQRWRRYSVMLLSENRWLAQRYGIDKGLIDFGKGTITAFPELVEEILVILAEDAEALGCTGELAHARTILARGTSAHAQRRSYEEARRDGADHEEALRAVVDHLVDLTLEGSRPACETPAFG